ncbi:MAG TPA: nuclear transport factor 2 family protein [Chitinophagaceae bacterium]|nr:nuclear transport factor 2 family protein [Chitinophagaceae bacterium]
MSKLFFILAVVILNSLIGCNSNAGMSATAKKNKEVNDAIMKAFEAGDFNKMGDYIAADAVDHSGETGDVSGLDNIVAAMKGYREQMGEMKSETIRELADDDYVMTWSKVTGRNMTMVEISKFKDGKAVEHWIYMDPKDMASGASDIREH